VSAGLFYCRPSRPERGGDRGRQLDPGLLGVAQEEPQHSVSLEGGKETLPVPRTLGGVAQGLGALRRGLDEQGGEEELGSRAIHGESHRPRGRAGRSR
jgi:hypothetical protein